MRDLRRAPGDGQCRRFSFRTGPRLPRSSDPLPDLPPDRRPPGGASPAGARRPGAGGPAANEDCLVCHGEDKTPGDGTGRPERLPLRQAERVQGARPTTRSPASPATRASIPRRCRTRTPMTRVDCGSCHAAMQAQHAKSLHGQAIARRRPAGAALHDCHGKHDILPVQGPALAGVAAARSRSCAASATSEGGAGPAAARHPRRTTSSRTTPRASTARGCCKKGLIVAPNCASCHTAHSILPHTDPASSIARRNIAKTCTQVPRRDRDGAPQGHQGRAVGEAGARPAGLRRLPPAAQDPQGLLRPGHGGQRLPALPRRTRRSRPRRTAGRCTCTPPTWRARATRRSSCSQCHSGRERLARARLRDDHRQGRLRRRATPRSASSTR